MTIFVFGSNLAGKHYGGAAKYAVDKFGAVMGVEEGMQGQSYAIPTLDEDFKQIPLASIEFGVNRFKKYAAANPDLQFYVTRIGFLVPPTTVYLTRSGPLMAFLRGRRLSNAPQEG